jgi:large subunit ribosomal protein L15
MLAHELRPPKGAKHARKRVGRGNAAGTGTYSTRGLKGQKSRAGRKPRLGFEGGQTRLLKRLPMRRGFTNPFRIEYTSVNVRDLERFDVGTEVTPQLLRETRVIKTLRQPVKILGLGELTKPLTVKAHRFSAAAMVKIEAAGGSAQELEDAPPRKKKRDRTRRVKAHKPEETTSDQKQTEEPEEGGEAADSAGDEGESQETENGDGS